MSVLTVIPARLGATRLPRKPLRLLGGVPVVVRVYQRVQSLGIGNACVVATDDQEIVNVCALYEVPVVLTSTNHPSGTDRVAEVAALSQFAHHDVILNVQGDEPFVTREALHGAVSQVASGKAEIGTVGAFATTDILNRPDVVKIVRDNNGFALYFSRAPIPFLRDPADATTQSTLVRQHVGVYAYSPRALREWVSLPPHPLEIVERLEQLRPLAHGLRIAVADVAAVPEGGIDTEDDLVRANARWMEQETTAHAAATGSALLNQTPSTS
ncbi:MAG: 3-deoxy-manno-octulosonate cytidylyltransferase [Gemmatimonadaceae bacterium]